MAAGVMVLICGEPVWPGNGNRLSCERPLRASRYVDVVESSGISSFVYPGTPIPMVTDETTAPNSLAVCDCSGSPVFMSLRSGEFLPRHLYFSR